MKQELIVKMREGHSIGEVLPAAPAAESTEDEIQVSRVHDIEPLISSTLGTGNLESMNIMSEADKENAFKNAYESLEVEDKRLYDIYQLTIPESLSAETIASDLKGNEKVEYVQFNQMNDLMLMPDAPATGDPLLQELYGLRKMECEEAWKLSEGDEVVVAVVDTGVDYNHPDLKNNMWRNAEGKVGYNFSENNDDPMDYHSHGTHVAGTVAAVRNNNQGVVGVAPHARIMALKIFPNALDTVAHKAIVWAADNGAKVINNSWGPRSRRPRNPHVEEAIAYATRKGVVVVFAAGNSDDDVKHYAPANHPLVVSVAATDENDTKAGFSNYGDKVTVAAPGKGILSCKFSSEEYSVKSGTSMAAPHVSGQAALVLKKNPDISQEELIRIIKEKVDPVQSTVPIGTGRVNAYKSVK